MMNGTRKDHFDRIYEMLRNNQAQQVLACILDQYHAKILPPYDEDPNHAWYIAGTVFFKQKNYSKAIMAFKCAIEEWREDLDAHLALGNAYSEAGDPGAARDILLSAYDISPGEPRITYNLGNILFDLGELDKAEFFYKSILNRADDELRRLARSNLKKIERSKRIPKDQS